MRGWWKSAVVAGGLGLIAGSGCYTAGSGWGGAGVTVSVGAFYDALSPYGAWFDSPQFGRVWRPYAAVVGSNFVPYASAGQWVDTDYGWAWDSDYAWGWAPFHYGRWFLDPSYGWVWIPGDAWAPAWVDWRYGGGFVGWAPLAPAGYGVGFGPCWSFVPVNQFGYRNPIHYAIPVTGMQRPWGVTRPVHRALDHGGTRFPLGPRPGRISREGGPRAPVGRITPPPPGVIAPARPVTARPPPQVRGSQRPEPAVPGRAAPTGPPVRSPGFTSSPTTPRAPPARPPQPTAPPPDLAPTPRPSAPIERMPPPVRGTPSTRPPVERAEPAPHAVPSHPAPSSPSSRPR